MYISHCHVLTILLSWGKYHSCESHKVEKLRCLGCLRYKFKLRFRFALNLYQSNTIFQKKFWWNFGNKSLYLLCGKRSYFCTALFLFTIFFFHDSQVCWWAYKSLSPHYLIHAALFVAECVAACAAVCAAVHCNVLRNSLDFMLLCVLQSVLQCVLHCVLQCIAVFCTP